MNIDERRFLSIDQVQGQIKNGSVQKTDNKGQNIQTGANSFASILNKIQESSDNTISSEELKFSKHATSRLQD